MLRIQYHRYSGPEEMRLETYELPALGEYVHDPRAVCLQLPLYRNGVLVRTTVRNHRGDSE